MKLDTAAFERHRAAADLRNTEIENVREMKGGEPLATERQMEFIKSLIEQRDWSQDPWATRIAAIAAGEGKPVTRFGASNLIDTLKACPFKKREAAPKTETTVPAGRYALPTLEGAENDVAFYQVAKPEKGRWAGYTFVSRIVGGDNPDYNLKGAQADAILARIAENIEEAMSLYGREIGRCGHCNRELTSEWRKRGIGPVCARKIGW